MTESLDDILSRRESAPETPVEEKTEAPAAEAAPETPEAVEQPKDQKMVPHEALHAEKQKVKRYTDEVAEFRKSNEALQRQVGELLQRVPVQQPPQQAAPDIFENAPEAIRHTVAPQFEQINQTLLAIAKDNAIGRFSEEKVNEAEAAFIAAVQSRTLDQADYQKVIGSPNRYAAAVQWHQRQLAQKEIGDDPAAYRAKVESEILEKYGIKPGEPAQERPAAVMPSNLASARNVGTRAGPAWSGPPPLNDIFKR